MFGGKKRARRESAMAFASANGLQYSEIDTFGLVALPFELLARAKTNECTNVVYGTWQGNNMWAFELQQDAGHPDLFLCAAAPIPTECPHIEIRRTTELWRAGNVLGFTGQDLTFESEAFNREFRVAAEDQKFGYDTVTAQMMDWLLQQPKEWRFVVSKNYAGVYRPLDDGQDDFTAEALDVMAGFYSRLPNVLASLYELKQQPVPVWGLHSSGAAEGMEAAMQMLQGLGITLPPGAQVQMAESTSTMQFMSDPSGHMVQVGSGGGDVLASGTPATATVVDVQDTGVAIGRSRVMKLHLRVSPGGGAPYDATCGTVVPAEQVGRVVGGATLPVKVDPANPQNLAIDWSG